MKNLIFYFLFLLLLFSCKKNNIKHTTISSNNDSIKFYYENIKKSSNHKTISNFYNYLATAENDELLRDKLSDITFEFYNSYDLKNLKKSSLILTNYSLESNDSLNLAKSYRALGAYYRDKNQLDSSFYNYLKCKKIYTKLKDTLSIASTLVNIGTIQYKIKDLFGSQLNLNKSYYIYKTVNDTKNMSIILNQLGLVSTDLKEYDKALEYFNKSFEIIKDNDELINSDDREVIYYGNLGFLFTEQKIFKNAILNLKIGIKKTKNYKTQLYSNLIDNLAYSKLKIKNYDSVPQLFQDALKIRDSLNNYTGVIISNIHLSEYYDAIKDTTFSIRYSKKALQLSKDSKNPFDIVLSLKQAASVDKKNASNYIKDYARISDSLVDAERKNKDRFARIQLETDELIKENLFLSEKNKRILYSMFAVLAILSVLAVGRAQYLKNRYLLLEQEQQRSNEKIYSLVISEQDKIEDAKNNEKKRISKELHDGVLGRLFGLRLNLDMLNNRTDEAVVEDRNSFLGELKLIEQDIREISHELSREKIALVNNFLSLTNALFENQSKVNKPALNTTIDPDIDWDLLSNTTRINLYRILQETLQNVNKYAKAKNIIISFKKDINGNLILSIFDDGIGFNTETKSKGIGLTNIVSRIEESNGTIEINSVKKQGTSFLIVIPLESKTIKF